MGDFYTIVKISTSLKINSRAGLRKVFLFSKLGWSSYLTPSLKGKYYAINIDVSVCADLNTVFSFVAQ